MRRASANSPRIIQAEVVSCRLEVPLRSLEQLPDQVGALALEVKLSSEELLLAATDGSSSLRFVVAGTRAQLAEVLLVDDDRGLFFQRVLGPLMVRYRGDLHIRLTWNTTERNSHGAFAEVTIRRGETTYPGLGLLRNVAAPPALQGGAASLQPEQTDIALEPLSPDEQEVERLLVEARTQWAEYQRLKGQRS